MTKNSFVAEATFKSFFLKKKGDKFAEFSLKNLPSFRNIETHSPILLLKTQKTHKSSATFYNY